MNKIIICFFIVCNLFFFSSCKKDKKKLPIVTTSTLDAEIISAKVSGVLYEEGDSKVTEKGICWGTTDDVSIANNKIISTTKEMTFTLEITGLEYEKTYFVRAYAMSGLGVSYGKVRSFTTLSNDLPNIVLSMASLPHANSADLSVQINQQTKSTFTTGLCWSTSAMPTVLNNTLAVTEIPYSNTVPFTNNYPETLQNLDETTTYYARAFCTNGISLAYSNPVTIITANPINLVSLNSLGFTDASVGASVTDINATAVTAVGICWSENPLPTVADNKSEQAYLANYTTQLTPLNPGTIYYLRAYINTSSKTIYSTQKKIITYKGTVTDYDGNSYKTVQIGNQEWMASNLKTTHYSDGTALQYAGGNYNLWVNSVNSHQLVYCYYGDQSSNNATYGKLYPAYICTANIAPTGWHVPSVTEWQNIFANNSITDVWDAPLDFDNNITRLSLSPGGQWNSGYGDLGQKGYFWGTPLTTSIYAQNLLTVTGSNTLISSNSPGLGCSIRCVKN